MRIERLTIRDFRSLAAVSIELDPHVTVLVGANNAGKTSILDALAAVLNFRGGLVFSEQDFRSTDASKSARAAPPIQVELAIAPGAGARFVPGELGERAAQINSDSEERYFLRLETRWNFDPSVAGLETTLVELRADGQVLGRLGRFPFVESLPLHPFGTERDLKRGLSGRWSDWGRILADARPSPEVRTRAMGRFQGASTYLVKNTPGLDTVREALGDAGTITGIGAMDVKLSAAPDDVDELLRRVGIELRLPGALRSFAGERHGHGTQGALLFAVYRLHAQRLCAGRETVCPVMTVEEPEVHLHPTAQRALGNALALLPGQVVMTSHSPEMVTARVRPILVRSCKGTATAKNGVWTSLVAAHPRALFARCLLLVEGMEALSLSLCAQALNFDLHERGVEVVDVRGQGNLLPLWETFGPVGFDLPTACLADGDAPQFLAAFIGKLHSTKRIASKPALAEQHKVLLKNAYFVTKRGRNIEEALVEDTEADVDAELHRLTAQDFAAWRSLHSLQRLSAPRCNRANALRSKRLSKLTPGLSLVSDLTDQEARVERLARNKSVIPDVIRALTVNGTDSSRIPPGFRQALQWVERATRVSR
jgi:putative ATP-dependent endonuclease of OLD family